MATVFIIGSGPAGVAASLYAKRGGADVIVISRGSGALGKAEKIQNYYGLRTAVSGKELEEDGISGAKNLGVKFICDEVVDLALNEDFTGFVIKTPTGKYAADAVILAAGSSRKTLPVPGLKELEGRGVSYCAICDAFFYRGKRVGVLGAGEYALHEAETLLPHAEEVTLFTNGQAPTVPVPQTIKINKEKLLSVEAGEENKRVSGIRLATGELVAVEGVFVALGVAGSVDLARKIGAAVQAGNILVDKDMATNVRGLFAAGDCTGGLYQIVKAAYEGTVAGLSVLRYLKEKK